MIDKVVTTTELPKLSFYLMFMIMLYVGLDITSNVVGYKMIPFLFLTLPGSAFIFPETYVISDVITEVYNYGVTRILIWCSVFIGFISTSMIMFVIYLPSAPHWNNAEAFSIVLGSTWRIIIGGYVAKFFGSFTNAILIAKFRIIFKNKYFILRCVSSSVIGELIYVIIAGTIILLGKTNLSNAVNIMISNYLAKIVFLIILAYPALMLANFLKKKENIPSDEYNLAENFNPFKIKL